MRAGFAVYRRHDAPDTVIIYAPFLGSEVSQIAVDLEGLRAVAMRGETPLARLLPCCTAQDDDRPAVPFWQPEHEAALQGLAEWFGWTVSDTRGTVYATPGGEAAEPLAVLYREPGCSTMFELGMEGIPGVNAAVTEALWAA